MSFTFHPEAEIEFNKAIDYYENIDKSLGYDFATEVYFAIGRTVALPDSWTIIDGDVRRTLVNRFPYGVLYSEDNGEIFITAIMHLHRNPEYWKNRN